jgi:CBS domain containing-hemolysin-like protein
MSPPLIPLIVALLASLWAALLALAEGALAANPQLSSRYLPRLFAEKPERLRRGLTIGRICLLTLAALGLSGAAQWWMEPLLPATGWLALLVTLTVLTADLLPRLIGLWRSRLLGAWAVRAAAATLGVLAPIFIAAGILDRAFARLFGVPAAKGPTSEIAQREMLLGVFALADTMVSEVMTPRIAMVGVDVHLPFDEVIRQAAAAEYARLPVFDGDLDHIVGVLYAKDLLETRFGAPGPANWQGLVRPIEIVPEVKTLDRQLRDFQRGPSHLAVVVDEFGGTAGIVTLEDVLEEIVGEIGDEYDDAQGPAIVEASPGVFDVDGRAPIDALADALGTPLAHEEVTTAGGLVYAALGHVPAPGEVVAIEGWRVTIARVDKRSIQKLRFERTAAPPEPDAA